MQRIRGPVILISNYFYISRDSLNFDTRSLDHTIRRCYSNLYLIYLKPFAPAFFRFPHVFTLHLYISLKRNIFLIPDDAVDRQKPGF